MADDSNCTENALENQESQNEVVASDLDVVSDGLRPTCSGSGINAPQTVRTEGNSSPVVKKDRKRKHDSSSDDSEDESDSSSSSTSSGSSSDECQKKKKKAKKSHKASKKSKKAKKGKSKKPKPSGFFTLGESQNSSKWEIANSLASYVNENMANYMPDDTIKKDILEDCPVPSNINDIPEWPKHGFLRKATKQKKFVRTRDQKLKRVGDKVRSILAPLSTVWSFFDKYRSSEGDWSLTVSNGDISRSVQMKDVATRLDQSVALTGQAINAVNYLRRLSVLSGLCGDDEKARDLLKECEDEIADDPEELFGSNAKSALAKEAKADDMKLGPFLLKRGGSSNSRRGGYAPSRKFRKRDDFDVRPFSDSLRPARGHHSEGGSFRGQRGGRGGYNSSGRGKYPGNHLQHPGNSSHVLEPHESGGRGSACKATLPFPLAPTISSCGSPKILSPTLGKTVKRSKHIRACVRMENTVLRDTKSPDTQRVQAQCRRGSPNIGGGCEDVGFGGNPSGEARKRPSFELNFSEGEKRWISEPHNKPKESKFLNPLFEIQNGNPEGCQTHPEGGGLDVQNRSEKCLLSRPLAPRIKEVHKIQMEGEDLSGIMHDVWTRTRTQEVYKASKGGGVSSKKAKHSARHLHRRPDPRRIIAGGNNPGKGHNAVPSPSPRLCFKLAKISSGSNSPSGVPGRANKQHRYDVFHSSRENVKNSKALRSHSSSKPDNALGTFKSDGKAEGHSPSIFSSSSPDSLPPAKCDQAHKRGALLFQQNISGSQRTRRAEMVVRKCESSQREPHQNASSGDDNLNRRSGVRGMGGLVRRSAGRRTLVRGRAGKAHQRAGVARGKVRSENILENKESEICSPSFFRDNLVLN